MKLIDLKNRHQYWTGYLSGVKSIFPSTPSLFFSSSIQRQAQNLIEKACQESSEVKKLFKKQVQSPDISKEFLCAFYDVQDTITKIITCITDANQDFEDPPVSENFANKTLKKIKETNDFFATEILNIHPKVLNQSFACKKLLGVPLNCLASDVLIGPDGLFCASLLTRVCGIYSNEVLHRSLVNSHLTTAHDVLTLFSNSSSSSNIVEIVKNHLAESRNRALSEMNVNVKWKNAFQNQWEMPVREYRLRADGKIEPLSFSEKLQQIEPWDFLVKQIAMHSFEDQTPYPENSFVKNIFLYKGERKECYLTIFLEKCPTLSSQNELGTSLFGEHFSHLQKGHNYLWSPDGILFYFLYCENREGSSPTYQAQFKTEEQGIQTHIHVNHAYAAIVDADEKILASYQRQQIDSVRELCHKFQYNESTMIPLPRTPKYLFYLEETEQHVYIDAFCNDIQASIIGQEGSIRSLATISTKENKISISLANGAVITVLSPFEAYFADANKNHELTVLDIETFDYSAIGIPVRHPTAISLRAN